MASSERRRVELDAPAPPHETAIDERRLGGPDLTVSEPAMPLVGDAAAREPPRQGELPLPPPAIKPSPVMPPPPAGPVRRPERPRGFRFAGLEGWSIGALGGAIVVAIGLVAAWVAWVMS